jgi:ABC-type nickel/cobalt efflux system permease component RcnA/hydrogenase/urease accessory protein HupE
MVNTNVGEFYAGMMHPLTSAEHLLPALALALLASLMGKKSARSTLLIFPLGLAVGILTGYLFPALDFIRLAGLLLLVVLGVMLSLKRDYAVLSIQILAAVTGLILGYRSGIDMAAAEAGFQFPPGVVLTGFIIIALVAAWAPAIISRERLTARILVGICFSAAGVLLMVLALLDVNLQEVNRIGIPAQKDLIAMIKKPELSMPVIFAVLTGSFIWGAGHALTPGHGKAIVAAYLVGARSTPWHAIYLGLTVTATHTLVVFGMGLITLFASHYILADQLYPWLSLLSGLIVVGMGATMAVSRIRGLMHGNHGHAHHHGGHTHDEHSHTHHHEEHTHHDHTHSHSHTGHTHDHHDHVHSHHHEGHTHDHDDHSHHHGHSHLPPGADGKPVTWRSLLGLGISGGLLPCPSALVLLLAAVSLGRVGLGMVLVTVFSLGLACVLITVGLLFIKGSRLVSAIPRAAVLGRWLPSFSALAIMVIGIVITVGAVKWII